jgi:hypothetical protein
MLPGSRGMSRGNTRDVRDGSSSRLIEMVDVHDEPFGVRERLLAGLTFAFGRRGRPDGSVDLWAEIVTS